jgi:hypothetical protein
MKIVIKEKGYYFRPFNWYVQGRSQVGGAYKMVGDCVKDIPLFMSLSAFISQQLLDKKKNKKKKKNCVLSYNALFHICVSWHGYTH